ncbi:MAG TPA: secondary thiamine-phosphate synthase enzyme YjbQ [Tepidisphaeraceae bacterium]|jgi:secondary thiamine-phosphate synthase enzyme|nr:secondary thiamine-phosphate synthase enzyme YjbQ [Tepidisphaeraceae bacterium]
MASHSTTERVRTQQRSQMVDITDRVAEIVRQQQGDGIAFVYVPHTTAGITIQENADPDVQHDLLKKLETLIPKQEPYYRHNEGNSDSHVKTALVGNSVQVLVERGQLVLGQWQGIYLCEFDGPRTREVIVRFFQHMN